MRLVLVLLFAIAACGRDNQPPPPSASVVRPQRPAAPLRSPLREVSVTDAAGAPVALGDRMKDVTVLAFWASWCGPCQAEMPLVDRYASSEHDSRIAIVAVNIDENRQDGVDAVADRHYALPVVFDPEEHAYQAIFHTLDAEIPAIAVVSRDGVATEHGYDGDLTDAQHVAHFRELAHAHLP